MMSDEEFVDFYNSTYFPIYRYVSANIFNKDLIEDIIQETYQTAYEKKDLLSEHPNVTGWLILTADYKMRKMYHKETQHGNSYLTDQEFLLGTSSIGGEEEIRLLELENVLEKILSKSERELLYQYYREGYTAKELMDKYKISNSCLKMRLKRIRDKIVMCI